MSGNKPASAVLTIAGTAVLCTVLAFGVGVTSRMIRSRFPGPAHPDAMAALVAMGAVCLAAVLKLRSLSPGPAVAGLSITLFAVWNAFTVGWLLVHGRLWDDLIQVSACSWLISQVAGLVLLFLFRIRPR